MNIIQKIKLAWSLKDIIETEAKEIKTMDIKSGWKSSEFWGKVAVQAVTIWGTVGQFVPAKYAVIVVVVAEGIYTIARTVLKVTQTIQAAKAGQPVVSEPVTATATVTAGQ